MLFHNKKCNLKRIKTGVTSAQCKESKGKHAEEKLLTIKTHAASFH